MPKLIISIDGVVIKEVTLAKDRTALGRRPYNDIVVDDLAISGEHAVLHMIGGEVYLEDLNSTNGTYVNGRPIKRQALEQGDLIEVGRYKIHYEMTGAGGADASTSARVVIPQVPSGPIPLASEPTVHAPIGGATGKAVLRVLSGGGVGREVSLQKVVTTVGKPGSAVVAVTRRPHGYVAASIDGGTTLNGKPLGSEAVYLQDGDVIDLGDTRMQFVVG
jgi:pSer/pThr/pTyr-binding forkhead associated (FHA) protein